MADKVPPMARYAIMICITCLPVFLLCLFFMCLPDDEPQELPKTRVYGSKEKDASKTEDSKEPAPAGNKTKKNKIE